MAAGNLIDGRAIAAAAAGGVAASASPVLKARGIQPGLAFVRVGEDPASKVYVGRKEKTCAELGIVSGDACPAGSHRRSPICWPC